MPLFKLASEKKKLQNVTPGGQARASLSACSLVCLRMKIYLQADGTLIVSFAMTTASKAQLVNFPTSVSSPF